MGRMFWTTITWIFPYDAIKLDDRPSNINQRKNYFSVGISKFKKKEFGVEFL